MSLMMRPGGDEVSTDGSSLAVFADPRAARHLVEDRYLARPLSPSAQMDGAAGRPQEIL
jgi:hypothetical protein